MTVQRRTKGLKDLQMSNKKFPADMSTNLIVKKRSNIRQIDLNFLSHKEIDPINIWKQNYFEIKFHSVYITICFIIYFSNTNSNDWHRPRKKTCIITSKFAEGSCVGPLC